MLLQTILPSTDTNRSSWANQTAWWRNPHWATVRADAVPSAANNQWGLQELSNTVKLHLCFPFPMVLVMGSVVAAMPYQDLVSKTLQSPWCSGVCPHKGMQCSIAVRCAWIILCTCTACGSIEICPGCQLLLAVSSPHPVTLEYWEGDWHFPLLLSMFIISTWPAQSAATGAQSQEAITKPCCTKFQCL